MGTAELLLSSNTVARHRRKVRPQRSTKDPHRAPCSNVAGRRATVGAGSVLRGCRRASVSLFSETPDRRHPRRTEPAPTLHLATTQYRIPQHEEGAPPGAPSLGMWPSEVGTISDPSFGGGAGPTIGICPANTEPESTKVIAIAIANRFMGCLSFWKFEDARVLTSAENRATSVSSCKLSLRQLISRSQ